MKLVSALVATAVVAMSSFSLVEVSEAKLVMLQSITRHGSRAPNDVTAKICPNNEENHKLFNVPFAQLTEIGMQEIYQFGEYVRKKYIKDLDFLPAKYGYGGEPNFKVKLISDAADRCLQSATVFGRSLYPDSTGPAWIGLQPMSVWMVPKSLDNLFDTSKAACKAILKRDLDEYARVRGVQLIEEKAPLIRTIEHICGAKIADAPQLTDGKEDPILAIKDISDDLVFNVDQHLPPLKGLTHEVRSEIRALSYQMLEERYYDTPQKITYWSSDMPNFLLFNMKAAMAGKNKMLMYSMHAHRELLYALSHMWGWKHNFSGLPVGAIPPGLSMIFELHQDEKDSSYYVRLYEWAPSNWTSTIHGKNGEVTLEKCAERCPFEEFEKIFTDHIAATGSWRDICGFTGQEIWVEQHADDYVGGRAPAAHDSLRPELQWQSSSLSIALVGSAMFVFASVAAVLVLRLNQQRRGYVTV